MAYAVARIKQNTASLFILFHLNIYTMKKSYLSIRNDHSPAILTAIFLILQSEFGDK